MRTAYMLLMVFMAFGIQSMAQVTVSLGVYTGAGSTNVLLSTSTTINRYSRTISVYTASEILAAGGMAGVISSLAWDKGGTGEYTSNDAYIKVSLKHVSVSAWPTSPVPDWNTEIVGATDVFTSSTWSIPTGTGWKTLAFTTPFTWNGIDNIAVFVEWDRSSTPTTAITWGRSTTTDANATRVGSNSLQALVLMVNSSRPLIQLTITPGVVTPVDSVLVATQGGVPAVINTNGGTLQMDAAVFPANANQSVTWSIVNGTGFATISTGGLVTAYFNGTVWAKAVSDQDTTKMDSLLINITNQVIPVVSVTVSTQGGVPAEITSLAGTLQMVASILPANANQDVSWSIVENTGTASISPTGLVTAQSNGTVWAKAVSLEDQSKKDSLQITMTNQGVGFDSREQEDAISIYPNPVNEGLLHIDLSAFSPGPAARILVLDILGHVVMMKEVDDTAFSLKLDGWPAGIYVLQLQDGQRQHSRKFILP